MIGYWHRFSSGFGNKQFVVLCINSKTSDTCFSSLVQQTAFSNFVLTFPIKDTFHFSLTQLLMLPIFINSLSKRKKHPQVSHASRLCYFGFLWRVEKGQCEERWTATAGTQSHPSDERMPLSCAFFALEWKQWKEPPEAILLNHFEALR